MGSGAALICALAYSVSSFAGQHQLDHRDIELGRFIHERLVAGLLEPDELLRWRFQRVEVRHARPRWNPVIAAPEKEEDRHLERGRGGMEIQPRHFEPHRVERKPEATHDVRKIEDRRFGSAENDAAHVQQGPGPQLALEALEG